MGRGPGRRGAAEAAAEEGPDRLLLVDQARCEALAVAGRLDRAGRLWCVDAHTRLELSMTGLSPEAFASMPARERAAANAMAYRGLSAWRARRLEAAGRFQAAGRAGMRGVGG